MSSADHLDMGDISGDASSVIESQHESEAECDLGDVEGDGLETPRALKDIADTDIEDLDLAEQTIDNHDEIESSSGDDWDNAMMDGDEEDMDIESSVLGESSDDEDEDEEDGEAPTVVPESRPDALCTRRRLRGKQCVASAPKRRRMNAKTKPGPEWEGISIPPAPERKHKHQFSTHWCKGVDCKFNVTNIGDRAMYQHLNAGCCMWCGGSSLKANLEKGDRAGKVSRALRFFWEHDKEVFKKAVQKMDMAHRAHFPLKALKMPQTFHSAAALKASLAGPKSRNILIKVLRRTLDDDKELYELALAAVPSKDRDTVRKAVAQAPQAVRRMFLADPDIQVQSKADEWKTALAHRKRALAGGDEEDQGQHAQRIAADKQHARRRFFPARASTWKNYRNVDMPPTITGRAIPVEENLPNEDDEACDESGLPECADMPRDAKSFQEWLRYGSWTMCKECHRLEKRLLKPVDMRGGGKAEIQKCKHCQSGGRVGYPSPQPDHQPRRLQGLTPDIVEALRPLNADPGRYERAEQGYRVHTAMTRIVWEDKSVNEKIAELPSGTARKKARNAKKFLLKAEQSCYKVFYKKHKAFLLKATRDQEEDDQEDAGEAEECIPLAKRRL